MTATEPVEGPDPAPDAPESDATALAVVEDPEISTGDLSASLDLIPGDREFRTLAAMAKTMAGSALVPRALQDKPADVLLVLLTGRDLGIAVTAAIRKCYVIDGQVSIAPALKLALVRSKGLGAVRPAPGNDASQATAVAYDPEGVELGRVTFTWEDAEKITMKIKGGGTAKLTAKDNWRNYPQRMLWARASGYCVDDFFPEAAFGLYSPDELGATTDENGEIIDLDSVEVPVGFAPAEAPKITDEQVEHLRSKAQALPDEAQRILKNQIHAAGMKLPISTAWTASDFGRAAAIMRSLQARADRGEFPQAGDDPGDEVEEAEVVNDPCWNLAGCVLPADHQGPCVDESQTEIDP